MLNNDRGGGGGPGDGAADDDDDVVLASARFVKVGVAVITVMVMTSLHGVRVALDMAWQCSRWLNRWCRQRYEEQHHHHQYNNHN